MNTKDERKAVNECLDALSERLYQISCMNGWNFSMLSVKSGVSYRNLQDIMYGKKDDIKLSTLVRISENLGEPISMLLGIERNPFEEHLKSLLKLCNETSIALKRGAAL